MEDSYRFVYENDEIKSAYKPFPHNRILKDET